MLAADTGISVSTISRIESGKRRPTLDLLIPLARAHRVALDQLVAAPRATFEQPALLPRVHLKPHRHRRGSVVVPLTRYPGRVQVFKQVLAPRPPKLVTHTGYEWLYVLAGTLRLIIGERDFTLHPGEVVGSPENRALSRDIAKRAITLLRDRDNLIPLRGDPETERAAGPVTAASGCQDGARFAASKTAAASMGPPTAAALLGHAAARN